MCEFNCGRPAVSVHHLRYPKRLGTEPLTDLVAVCNHCHETSHGIRRKPFMHDIVQLDFHGTRIAGFYEKDEIWLHFRATLKALGHGESLEKFRSYAGEMWGYLDDDTKRIEEIPDDSGKFTRRGYFISKPGAYHLASKFDTPQSIPFRRWLHHEVVPAIERTGSYSVNVGKAESSAIVTSSHAQNISALKALAAVTVNHDERIEALEHRVHKDPEEFILVTVACREIGHDPNLMVRGRQTLASRAGAMLQQSGCHRGPQERIRLEGSSVDTAVNTWRRRDAHEAVERAYIERGH